MQQASIAAPTGERWTFLGKYC